MCCAAPLGKPLVYNSSEEHGVSDQIPPPQPLGLKDEPVDPLTTQRADPIRCARHAAGDEIKQCPNTKKERGTGVYSVSRDPKLLQRIAHRYQNNIGIGGPDCGADPGVVARCDIAVMEAHNTVPWIPATEDRRGALYDIRPCA